MLFHMHYNISLYYFFVNGYSSMQNFQKLYVIEICYREGNIQDGDFLAVVGYREKVRELVEF